MLDNERYMPLCAFAKVLGVQSQTLKRWLDDLGIEYFTIRGNNADRSTILIPKKNIKDFIAQHTPDEELQKA